MWTGQDSTIKISCQPPQVDLVALTVNEEEEGGGKQAPGHGGTKEISPNNLPRQGVDHTEEQYLLMKEKDSLQAFLLESDI